MSEPAPGALPPTSISLQALGHFVRVMERRCPGVLDEWVDGLQDEAMLNEIVRLRGPRESPAVRVARSGALEWAKHVRLVTLAIFGQNITQRPPAPSRARPRQGQRRR